MWLIVNEVADLLEVSDRTIRTRIYEGQFKAREIKSNQVGRRGGKTYQIHISSLPPEARRKYIENIMSGKINKPEKPKPNATSDHTGAVPLILTEYIKRFGSEAVDAAIQIEKAIQDIEGTSNRIELGQRAKHWANHFEVDERTLRNWRRDYAAEGLVGLLRKEREDKGNRQSTCNAVIDRLKVVYLDKNRVTLKEAYKQVQSEAKQTGPETCTKCHYEESCTDMAGNGWKIGSYKTALRIINELEYGELKRYRGGLQECRADAMPKGRVDFTKYQINERWVSDHHVCDFYCVDENGYLARPQLTIWQDFRSRVVTGLALSFQGNARTIGLAFAHGILPKPDSQIKGIPKEVLMDNGKDYRSHYLGQPEKVTGNHEFTTEMRGLFSILKIQSHYCKPYSPWGKPCESFFKTFKIQFSVHMPGYTNGSPDTRPENLEKDLKKLKAEGKIMTIPQAYEMILNWIINDYHNNIHSELGDSPINIYMTAPRYEGGTVSKEVASILLHHTETRTVRRDGINFKKALYKHRELYPLQEKEVVVRFDPYDLSEIIIEHEGKTVCIAERYTPMRTQEDIEANAKEQAYYMKRIKDKHEMYRTGSTPVRRGKSKEAVIGELLDKPGQEDVVRITGLEQAAKKRRKGLGNSQTTPPPAAEAMEHKWYLDGYEQFKKQAT